MVRRLSAWAVLVGLLLLPNVALAFVVMTDGGSVGVFPDSGAPSPDAAVVSVHVAPPPADAGAPATTSSSSAASSVDNSTYYPPGSPVTLPSGTTPVTLWRKPTVYPLVWGPTITANPKYKAWLDDLLMMIGDLEFIPSFYAPLNTEYTAGGANFSSGGANVGERVITPANGNGEVSTLDVAVELEHQLAIGVLPTLLIQPGGNLTYVVFLPPTVRDSDGGGSCWAYFGLHQYDATLNAAYIIIPFCDGNYPDGNPGVVSAQSGLEYVLGHELLETMTDPFVGNAWWARGSTFFTSELEDICNGVGYASVSIDYQSGPHVYSMPLLFSNKAYVAGTSVPGTNAPGCVSYPQTYWSSTPSGGLLPFTTCLPLSCSYSPSMTVCGTTCSTQTQGRTVPDPCGNPVTCPTCGCGPFNNAFCGSGLDECNLPMTCSCPSYAPCAANGYCTIASCSGLCGMVESQGGAIDCGSCSSGLTCNNHQCVTAAVAAAPAMPPSGTALLGLGLGTLGGAWARRAKRRRS